MPQCWLSNSTAQAIALAREKSEVMVRARLSLAHSGSVTYLATKECLDLISGKGSDMVEPVLRCAAGAVGDTGVRDNSVAGQNADITHCTAVHSAHHRVVCLQKG